MLKCINWGTAHAIGLLTRVMLPIKFCNWSQHIHNHCIFWTLIKTIILMVFCTKWCPLNYLMTSGCGAGREQWCLETHHTLHPISPSPIFLTFPYILFIKIKSIVAVGLCCILRKDEWLCASLRNFSNVALTISKKKKKNCPSKGEHI